MNNKQQRTNNKIARMVALQAARELQAERRREAAQVAYEAKALQRAKDIQEKKRLELARSKARAAAPTIKLR